MSANSNIGNLIQGIVQPLQSRLRLLAGRATLKAVDDLGAVQKLTLATDTGETLLETPHPQPYGFTAHPIPGADVVLLCVGGNRANALAEMVEGRSYRLTGLAQGEVAIHDDQGQKVVLHRDRIEVTAPKVVVNSADIHLGGEGGQQVARIGDMVQVTGGSSAGLHPIVQGSSNVRAT